VTRGRRKPVPDDGEDDGREPFVRYLEWLRDDRYRSGTAMAALRRANGQDLRNARPAWPYVLRWCSKPENPQMWRDETHLAVAVLFARHQISWPPHDEPRAVNMGASLARLRTRSGDPERFDPQVALLLGCDREGVCRRLSRLITPLAQWAVPIQYSVLLRDLLGWKGSRGRVALRWARAYYGRYEAADDAAAVSEEDVVDE
jgi:CRISPR type I-E-associated protein CasB/Cse2